MSTKLWGKRDESGIRIVVVGDPMIGKTCTLITYHAGEFPEHTVPTLFDNTCHTMELNGTRYNLLLVDTAGSEDYDSLRASIYPMTDCFLLCFAVDMMSSYSNVQANWAPELKHYCPNAPIILVGTKKDLRDPRGNPEHLSKLDGDEMKRKIQATAYMECSALKKEGLDELFKAAVKTVVAERKPKKFCDII